jgi:predicted RNA-binding Zn ribbon-like protein
MAWLGDDESKPAPEPLARVQALVNTAEREEGRDRLVDDRDARPWLVDQGFLDDGDALSARDLALVRDVREALRAVLIANSGGPAPSDAALAPLHSLAAAGSARIRIDGSTVQLDAAGDSLAARLAGLLLIVRDAQRDGSWARLRTCANDECLWAFYDRSRNHGGHWCTMATCGNKLKNRDFRARRRSQP